MENTRKLQFAAELMEEVQEDTDDNRVNRELQAMRQTMDEMRHRCLMERIERVSEEKEEKEIQFSE